MFEKKSVSFARLAQNYLRTLKQYTEAKTAVSVVQGLGQESGDVEYHAARLQDMHREAFDALVRRALETQQAKAVAEAV